jgi:hypothetical protein
MNLLDDPPVVRADPHPAASVASGLVADRARTVTPPVLDPEDEPSGEKHQRQYKHRKRRMHGEPTE